MNDTRTQITRKPNRYDAADNFTPAIVPGQQQYPMQQVDPQVQRSLIERVLSTPAPVPSREMRITERQRLEGANEKSTPMERARAAILRSLPVMAVVVFAGLVVYVGIGQGWIISIVTVLACLVTLGYFNALEYRHSQPGVERLRAGLDHRLETMHEGNRHTETLTAIHGDLALKNRMLDIVTNKMIEGKDHD